MRIYVAHTRMWLGERLHTLLPSRELGVVSKSINAFRRLPCVVLHPPEELANVLDLSRGERVLMCPIDCEEFGRLRADPYAQEV